MFITLFFVLIQLIICFMASIYCSLLSQVVCNNYTCLHNFLFPWQLSPPPTFHGCLASYSIYANSYRSLIQFLQILFPSSSSQTTFQIPQPVQSPEQLYAWEYPTSSEYGLLFVAFFSKYVSVPLTEGGKKVHVWTRHGGAYL